MSMPDEFPNALTFVSLIHGDDIWGFPKILHGNTHFDEKKVIQGI